MSTKPKRPPMTEARAHQISNHVSEEYVDHGKTSFATKAELCEALIWFRNHHSDELWRKDDALNQIHLLALKGRLYPSV